MYVSYRSKHHSAALVPAAFQLLDRTLVMLDDKEQVQEQKKNELSSSSEVTDRTIGRIRNGKNLHQSIKWVSRVHVAWRPMCWVLRSKFRNSSTTPLQPPVPPRPPDLPVHLLDPCSTAPKPSPPWPPDSLRYWVCNYTHGA
jgi:hypothetical protein